MKLTRLTKSNKINLFNQTKLFYILVTFFVLNINFSFADNKKSYVSVEYLPGWEETDQIIQGGLAFKLDPSWKTYWRNPGPYGVQPRFTWEDSENVERIEWSWPEPKIINQSEIKVLGYDNTLILPLKIVKIDPLQKTYLRLNISFGICSNICILKQLEIVRDLSIASKSSTRYLIEDALKTSPREQINESFIGVKCDFIVSDGDLWLSHKVFLPVSSPISALKILEYSSNLLTFSYENTTGITNEISTSVPLTKLIKKEGLIQRNLFKATLFFEGKGLEFNGCE